MRALNYRDLRVYQFDWKAAMEIYGLSKSFPPGERYALANQIRRASRSVCTNSAERWRKRRYEAAFVSKLGEADTEAAETEVHLDFALSCGYIKREQHAVHCDDYDHICRQLRKMMDDAVSWCGSTDHIAKELAPYVGQCPSNAAPES